MNYYFYSSKWSTILIWKVKARICFFIVIAAVLAIFYETFIEKSEGPEKTKCTPGKFLLPSMNSCHLWLTCTDIKKDVNISSIVLGTGAQKIVKEGRWHQYPVAVNVLDLTHYSEDLMYGLEMLKLLSSQPKIIQLVGWCVDNGSLAVVITEKHSLGSADNVASVLEHHFPQQNTLATRFRLCFEFVFILHILHSQPGGPYVMCDTNDPMKTLSQFLLTDNLTMVLNDVDALPQVRRSSGHLIKCGKVELSGPYVAPEQLWPFDEIPFIDAMMPSYDEKVDIWKIPDVCNVLIGDAYGAGALKLHLFNIHSQCRELEPSKRPTAEKILQVYNSIKRILKL
ncbi:protein O-mannose kinase [Biomphalaria pfeifferi]|uniref:Protein O-mannose kinase n=1 Tax=Biomphalaria pfeifferi TaxID=112525 RepID=A0AAD8FE91_BIOPF|nr:protein O-mannose kinase [Biomphalaria pfeifferi]